MRESNMDGDVMRKELRRVCKKLHDRGATDDEITDALVTLATDTLIRMYGWDAAANILHDFAKRVDRRMEEESGVTRHSIN